MKKLALTGIISILATVALSGCMSVPQEETTTKTQDNTQVTEETTTPQSEMKEEEKTKEEAVNDEDNEETEETSMTDTEKEEDNIADKFTETYTGGHDLFYACNDKVKDFNAKINADEIKMYMPFQSNSMSIVLYKTKNPDKLTKEELKAIVDPCGELGANQVLKATDDYIIIGYPYCTAGVAPDPELQPNQYKDYEKCMVVQNELKEKYNLQ